LALKTVRIGLGLNRFTWSSGWRAW